MDLAVGAIVEGKVTGITKFGAFVALPEGKSGMVHISEVASTFVNDIKDFLQEGQQVKVKIINIDQAGRINLSIKKAQPQEPRQPRQERREGGFAPRQPRFQRSSAPRGRVQQAPKDPSTMKAVRPMCATQPIERTVRAAADKEENRGKPRFCFYMPVHEASAGLFGTGCPVHMNCVSVFAPDGRCVFR